ncbi:unnamed protein product [Chilo suppressalis]|uniref:Uncharacterized protein n=1 Tax=Chilo suppressalis TaxID=168631 RepID=A0ABN8B8T2_CHISP|nr:unnamed protein product [Chilo suppressalis]
MLDKLPRELRTKVGNELLTTDSQFKKKSDALLQYVCGRRAEIIEQRRGVYKVQSKALNEILHNIPLSETHLFSDDALTEAVKACSNNDIRRFFAYSNRTKSANFRTRERFKTTRTQTTKNNDRNTRGFSEAARNAFKQTRPRTQPQPQLRQQQFQAKRNWGSGKRNDFTAGRLHEYLQRWNMAPKLVQQFIQGNSQLQIFIGSEPKSHQECTNKFKTF